MYYFLKSEGVDLWDKIENDLFIPIEVADGEHVPKTKGEWSEHDKYMFSFNIRAMHMLKISLNDFYYAKNSKCSNAKDIWDSLDSMYNSNHCCQADKVENTKNYSSYQQMEQVPQVDNPYKQSFKEHSLIDMYLIALEDDEKELRRMRSMECSMFTRCEGEEIDDEVAQMYFMAMEESSIEVPLNDDVIEFAYDELVSALKVMNDELELSHKKNKLLKSELASLRKENETSSKDDKPLDNNSLRPPSIKYGLSYSKFVQAPPSKIIFVKASSSCEPSFQVLSPKVCLKSSMFDSKWYLDSECSRHIIQNANLFLSLEKKYGGGQVTFADNGKGKIVKIGKIAKENSHILDKVLLVDGLKHNLLSVSQLRDKGCRVIFEFKSYFVSKMCDNKMLFVGERVENNYVIDLHALSNKDIKCFVFTSDDSWTWYRRLAHASMDLIANLNKDELVDGLPKIKFQKNKVSDVCQMGKQVKRTFKSIHKVSTSRPLQLLHIDLFGPTRVASLGGAYYTFVIIDDYSRYTWVTFLTHRDEYFDVFERFSKKVQK
ncbi:uncharacterized protein LOC131179464 [Hevea brasiliensis]|uniref:uncharacterized protein LOC131179464 n=1 Tax=Hevea brasiliensis TaxID=3981 RepID=UPI0025FC1351|nr:uncharacterized protein LOC131179464 [Hevea brasiliensis]